MVTNILNDILSWSVNRPLWQRDAMRRLFTAKALNATDIADLADLCKAAHGLSSPKQAEVLAPKHLAIAGGDSSAVNLVSLTHHVGVNALAPEQTVFFGPHLTVVYGENGSGKSGYSRILKRACRSRFVEDILGDVIAGTAPLAAKATITIKGDPDVPILWSATSAPSPALAAISVFDARCVPVYLKDKTDVAFRPFSLDVFDGLASACTGVRRLLDSEKALLSNLAFVIPSGIVEGTAARSFLVNLTGLTKDRDLIALATLSRDEQLRLNTLEGREQDLKAADPKQRAKELNQKAVRIESVAKHVDTIVSTLAPARLAALEALREQGRVAQQAAETLRNTMVTPDLLPETGSVAWRRMWETGEAFAHVSTPGSPFPPAGLGAKCPYCQQQLSDDAEARLKHFAEFVASSAQVELRNAEQAYTAALKSILQLDPTNPDLLQTCAEIVADDAALSSRMDRCLADAATIVATVGAAKDSVTAPITAIAFDPGVVTSIKAMAAELRARAATLQTAPSALSGKDASELAALRARVALQDNIDSVRAEIDRKNRINAYSRAIEETSTNQITIKSTELTRTLITDQLTQQFQTELKGLEFTHLLVELQAAGGSKGALFHKLVFRNAPGVTVTDVLSEGEGRALSLAAFLTELSNAPSRSGIIFDDPVSSLDHIWRERIARRLVEEATTRQVIVFTHDLVFLRSLMAISAKASVRCDHQYLRREGQSGISSPDLPWVAMNVRARIGVLKKRLQDATATFNKKGVDAYENEARDIFGMLREAWERGITEILLNDTVDRYRQSIETKRVGRLHDITEQDCKDVDNGMTEASRWMRGHDEAPAEGTPFPSPAVLKQRIDDFDDWTKRITQRRK